jgi:hypothetical protein
MGKIEAPCGGAVEEDLEASRRLTSRRAGMRGSCPILDSPPQRFRPLPERVPTLLATHASVVLLVAVGLAR